MNPLTSPLSLSDSKLLHMTEHQIPQRYWSGISTEFDIVTNILGKDVHIPCLSYGGKLLTIRDAQDLLPFPTFATMIYPAEGIFPSYWFPLKVTRDDMEIRFQGYVLTGEDRLKLKDQISPFLPSVDMLGIKN